VAGVRKGGPAILECLTARVGGHYEGDPQRGRDPAEQAAAKARDPVEIARAGLGKAEAEQIDHEVAEEIAAAVAFARAAPEPAWDDAIAAVYTAAG